MTETFYLKVEITSDNDPEFLTNEDNDEYSVTLSPAKRKVFNRRVEKAIKQILMSDADYFETLIEEDEGLQNDLNGVLEEIAGEYYDAETDLVAVAEELTYDVKFTAVKRLPQAKQKV